MCAWLLVLFCLTFVEFFFCDVFKSFPEESLLLIGLALFNNLIFWLKTWLFFLPVFTALFFFRPSIAKTSLIILLSLLAALHLALVVYFSTTLVPLGADIFGYSIADVKQTIGASSVLNLPVISVIIIILTLSIVTFIFIPPRIGANQKVALVITIASLATLSNALKQNSVPLNSEYENSIVLHKSDYFFSTGFNYFFPKNVELDIYADSYILQYEGSDTSISSFVFPDEIHYPFFHTNEAPDVLTPFFKPIEKTPNIVFLLVEGLGRAFTNEGAYLGNFTPFLDSLSGKSLYWKNFLSNGGRTFGVLPFVFGSMPFGKNGIWELNDQLPNHLSLYSLLRYNGFQTSFYYGGNAGFDNMKLFLQRNAVNEINDLASIPPTYEKLPAKANGFSWGYADDQVYSYFLKNNKSANAVQPSLSVLLTVATHDPFLIQNQSKYLDAFEQRMDYLGFNEAKKSSYRVFRQQYSTILYADHAIGDFFRAYEKRADYSNTIFIITGDHRMPEIPLRSKIDRFHVPLLIYSPLLKRTAQIESISTHLDIVPSLLAFLKKNTTMKLPATGSWIGSGLDTVRSFRNIHSYPLIQTKTAMIDFVQGTYHLNDNQLFQLNRDLEEIPVKNDAKLSELTSSFNYFKNKMEKLSKEGKLLPDSLFQQYKIH